MIEMYCLVAAFCALQWLDVWTTNTIQDLGGEELNPLIDLKCLNIYKAVACIVVFLGIIFLGRSLVAAPVISRALWALDGWFGAVVFGNILVIRKLKR